MRVFETHELLEYILQGLPMEDIFIARAVCRQWRDLIKASLPLRQATYYESCSKELLTLVASEVRPGISITSSMPPLSSPEFTVNPCIPSRSTHPFRKGSGALQHSFGP
ncbi:hypothetical protein LTR37_007399, partial [Vermiconidia calcicola]